MDIKQDVAGPAQRPGTGDLRSQSATRLIAWLRSNSVSVVLLALLCVTILVPLVYLLVGAFSSGAPGAPGRTFTLMNLKKVYASESYLKPVLNTLLLSIIVTTLSTVLGTLLAWMFVRINLIGKRFVRLGLMVPLFVSPFVGAVEWVTLYTPNAGFGNQLLNWLGLPQFNIFSLTGTIVVMTVIYTPYVFLFISDALAKLNTELESAGSVVGASRWSVFRHITFKLLTPAVVSIYILIFIFSAEMFSIPGLLAARDGFYTLSYLIYLRTTGYPLDLPGAAAAGTLLLVLAALGVLLHRHFTKMHRRFEAVGGKDSGRRPLPVGKATRIVASAIVGIYVLVTTILPFLALVLRSLMPYFSISDPLGVLTLDNYVAVLSSQALGLALGNSLKLAAISAVLAVLLGGLLGHITVRKEGFLPSSLNFLANIPLGMPGTVFGVALIWAYIGSPIYGTLYIVAIGILVKWLPVVVRMMQTAVMQVSPELGDAADVCGASPSQRMRFVFVPLYRSSLSMIAIMAFIQAFQELAASALIVTGKTTTLPVLLFNYMFDGSYAQASVIAIIDVVTLGIISMLLIWAGNARRKALPQSERAAGRRSGTIVTPTSI